MAIEIENLKISDITLDSSIDDIEQVYENIHRESENEVDDIRKTKQDLSLYSLRARINNLPTIAHTGEFKHLEHKPFIDDDFVGFVHDDYKTGSYRGDKDLQYCKTVPGNDDTVTHEERQIGRMWKAKVDTKVTNPNDDDYKDYDELNYGLLHLKDKFKIDNMWAYAHPQVTDKRIADTSDGINYKGDTDPNYNSTFVYFPHHIDEIYGMSNLGQMIIKSYEGEAALAKTGSYKGKDKYGAPDVNSEVNGGRNGLMSRKDKTDFDRINAILNTVPTGAKMQQISYTGEFKHLNFTEIGEGGKNGLYTDPESHAAFCSTMKPFLAAPNIYDDNNKLVTPGTNGFMSTSDRTIMHRYLNIDDTHEIIGKNYAAHDYVHVTDPGYKHVPAKGKANQLLGYGGNSGVAAWINRDVYIGDEKGITVSKEGVVKDAQGIVEFTISPIFSEVEIKDSHNTDTYKNKVARGYHTHDGRYINSYTEGTEVLDGSLRITNTLEVGKNITGNADLEIKGNITAGKDVNIGEDLNVDGSTDIANDLTVGGNFTLNGDLNTDGDINTSGDIRADGAISTKDDITAEGNITIGGTAHIGSDTTIDGNLTVKKEITANDKLTITNGGASIKGDTSIDGDLSVTGDITSNNTITGKNIISKEKLTVNNGGIDVTGNSIIKGSLTVNDDANIKGGLTVNDDANIKGDLTVGGKITGNNGAEIKGTSIFGDSNGNHVKIDNGNITATGKITASNLEISNKIKTKDLEVTGTLDANDIIGNTLTIKETVSADKLIANTIEVSGGLKGNADTATRLETARLINNTSFDGSADITTAIWGTARNISISDSAGYNTGAAVSINGSQNYTLTLPGTISATLKGNADTATKLATKRTINGTDFDGSGAITTAKWGTARNIYITDNSSSNTGPAVSVDGSGNATLKLPANIKGNMFTGSLSGNASSASQLQTSRTFTIGNTGKSFNGTGNVSWSLSEIGAAATKHRHTADELELPTVDITKVYINGVARTAKLSGNTLIFE